MAMPKFTAEAGLYQTSGYYRTSEHTVASSRPMIGTIHLAAIDVPGEVIVITEEVPWFPPSWGGHTGSGGPIGGSDPGGGEGGGGSDDGGKPIPEKSDKPTRVERMGKAWGKECEKKPTFKEFWECCDKKSNDCINENTKKHGPPSRELECADAGTVCKKSPDRPST